jgi:hypothetical protein
MSRAKFSESTALITLEGNGDRRRVEYPSAIITLHHLDKIGAKHENSD